MASQQSLPGNKNKRLQEMQENRQQDLLTLITSIEDIIIEIDLNKTFKNVWTRDDNLLFMPRSMFLGKTIEEVFGKELPLFSQMVDEVIASGETKDFVYKDIDSTIDKWYRAKIRIINKSQNRQEHTLVVIIQDYTETVMYENALKEAALKVEQGKRLLDISQELSLTSGWEYDVQTRKITLTKQAYLLYDVEDSFVPTLDSMRTFYDKTSWMILKTCSLNAIKTKTPYDIELQITTGKNIKKWVRTIGMPVEKDNHIVIITGALMDISKIKEIEEELTAAKNTAETTAKEKADFLSIMSHEIRTPLNNIIGLLNLLKSDHTPEQDEYVHNLIFSANHLLQLINDILDFHRIESSKSEVPLAQINLTQLIKDIQSQFIPFAKEKGIRLINHLDDHIPALILANPIRIGQIFNNLISNAIKFTETGEVTITAWVKSLQHNSVTIHFSVQDTGIGIPEEFHDTIFESFRQLTQSGIRKYPSTGLGLTITKKLIELHDSQIFLASPQRGGTEFYFDIRFRLPVLPNNLSEITTKKTPADFKDKLPGIRLLLIEDNPISIMIAKNQLNYFGINPDCAGSGAETLALLELNQYDIALLDLHLPDMDGYAIAKTMRKKYPAMKIIIFTADVMSEIEKRFSALDITAILHKPFLPEDLLNILLKATREGNAISYR